MPAHPAGDEPPPRAPVGRMVAAARCFALVGPWGPAGHAASAAAACRPAACLSLPYLILRTYTAGWDDGREVGSLRSP